MRNRAFTLIELLAVISCGSANVFAWLVDCALHMHVNIEVVGLHGVSICHLALSVVHGAPSPGVVRIVAPVCGVGSAVVSLGEVERLRGKRNSGERGGGSALRGSVSIRAPVAADVAGHREASDSWDAAFGEFVVTLSEVAGTAGNLVVLQVRLNESVERFDEVLAVSRVRQVCVAGSRLPGAQSFIIVLGVHRQACSLVSEVGNTGYLSCFLTGLSEDREENCCQDRDNGDHYE